MVKCDCVNGRVMIVDVTDEEAFDYTADQDAWGVWWRNCGECDGTGFQADIDEDVAVAVLGGML